MYFLLFKKQSGAALLIFMLLLIMGVSTVITSVLTLESPAKKKEEITRKALSRAKQALIGYVLKGYEDEQEFFRFPCPDIRAEGMIDEGGSDSPCGSKNTNSVGRFPWRSLDLETIKDGNDECLWYVVSGNFKDNPGADLLNEDSYGYLRVFNSNDLMIPVHSNIDTKQNYVVAAIISPGSAYNWQMRESVEINNVPSCGGNYEPQQYLDSIESFSNAIIGEAANGVDDLVHFMKDYAYGNDVITFITRQELLAAIGKRGDLVDKIKTELLKEVSECFRQFALNNAYGRLPWPAPVDFTPVASDYADNVNYDDSAVEGFLGRVPFIVDTADNLMGVGLSDKNIFDSSLCGNMRDDDKNTNNINERTNARALYQHWKDHLFYIVSSAKAPAVANAEICTAANCISINNTLYSAAFIYANSALPYSQSRATLPPIGDAEEVTDDRRSIDNYLEGINASNYPDNQGNLPYYYVPSDDTFNDILYCIPADINLQAVECSLP